MYEKKKIVNGKLAGGNNDGELPCKFCDRPKMTLKCGKCGYSLANMRLRKTCAVHPRCIDLMDLVNKCPTCKGPYLEEIGDAPTKTTSFTPASSSLFTPAGLNTRVVEPCFDPPPPPPPCGRGWRLRSPPVSPPGGCGPVVTCNLASLKDPSFVASRQLFHVDDPPRQELSRAPLSFFKTKQQAQDVSRPAVVRPPAQDEWRQAPAAPAQDWRRQAIVQEPAPTRRTVPTASASNDWRSAPNPSSISPDLSRPVREPARCNDYIRPATRLEPPPDQTSRPTRAPPAAPVVAKCQVRVEQNCLCNRKVSYVLCSTCGFYKTGVRKFVKCSNHPNPSGTIQSCPDCDAGLDALDEG